MVREEANDAPPAPYFGGVHRQAAVEIGGAAGCVRVLGRTGDGGRHGEQHDGGQTCYQGFQRYLPIGDRGAVRRKGPLVSLG